MCGDVNSWKETSPMFRFNNEGKKELAHAESLTKGRDTKLSELIIQAMSTVFINR